MMEGVFVIYVLENPKQRRYIGITSNLLQRIDAHCKGLSKFTKGKGPWHLVWMSIKLPHTKALQLEKLLKRQKGGKGLVKLLKEYRGS